MHTIALMVLAASLFGPAAYAATPADLAAFMEGKAQTRDDDPDYDFRETRRVIPAPDGAPAGGAWVYLELAQDGALYRQRVFHYTMHDDGRIAQQTYSFADPEKFASIVRPPALFHQLSMEDLTASLEPGCIVYWSFDADSAETPWRGFVSPDDCTIVSARREARIAIEAETRLGPDIIQQTERGYDAEGNVLFGTAPGEFIVMERIRP